MCLAKCFVQNIDSLPRCSKWKWSFRASGCKDGPAVLGDGRALGLRDGSLLLLSSDDAVPIKTIGLPCCRIVSITMCDDSGVDRKNEKHACVHTYIHTNVRTHVRTHIHTHAYMCTYLHT